jgi:DNA-binding NarL/FixJ family response regulator
VLILTMHASEDLAAHTFAAGASGFALKSQDATAVLHAIRTVGQGSRYLAPSLPPRLLERPRGVSPPRGMGELSPREREVFNLIIQGQSNRTIAERLSISIKTVEAHRAGINRKLDAHSTADLVRVAARHGLLST